MLYQAKWTVSTYKIMTATTTSPSERSTYRHGDLQRALLEAGIQLARGGGPDAVVLREATRRAGVVPNAAYRHFASRQELLQAVRSAALSALACERLAPVTCASPGQKRDCSARRSWSPRSPTNCGAQPIQAWPETVVSIP